MFLLKSHAQVYCSNHLVNTYAIYVPTINTCIICIKPIVVDVVMKKSKTELAIIDHNKIVRHAFVNNNAMT